MIRRKSHIEHAIEKPFVYVTNVADGDLLIDAPDRAWFPQRMPVIQRGELLPVNVERLVNWHGGKLGWGSLGSATWTNVVISGAVLRAPKRTQNVFVQSLFSESKGVAVHKLQVQL
jgi:hypothetical protein